MYSTMATGQQYPVNTGEEAIEHLALRIIDMISLAIFSTLHHAFNDVMMSCIIAYEVMASLSTPLLVTVR